MYSRLSQRSKIYNVAVFFIVLQSILAASTSITLATSKCVYLFFLASSLRTHIIFFLYLQTDCWLDKNPVFVSNLSYMESFKF